MQRDPGSPGSFFVRLQAPSPKVALPGSLHWQSGQKGKGLAVLQPERICARRI